MLCWYEKRANAIDILVMFLYNTQHEKHHKGSLEDAYLVYPVSVMSDSFAVKRVNPDRYYMIDDGIRVVPVWKWCLEQVR